MSPAAWGLCGVVVGWAVAQVVIEVIRAMARRRSWDEFRARQDRAGVEPTRPWGEGL